MQGVEIFKDYFVVQYVFDQDSGEELHYQFEIPTREVLEELMWNKCVPYYENEASVIDGHIGNIGEILEYIYQRVYGAESFDELLAG